MRSRLVMLGLAAVAAAAAAGCGSSGNSSHTSSSGNSSHTSSAAAVAASTGQASKAPIKVLWIGDTTGPLRVYGKVQLAGFEGAAAYYNAHGGIDGHKVIVSHVSDNGDPTTSVSVLLQQLEKGTPTMLWWRTVGGTVGALTR